MLSSLRIGNFKAFADTQHVPVRPLTLIFGPNSSGKSSIIHSLALVHEAVNTGEIDLYRTDIGGNSIDLGGFLQYIHRRQPSRRMEWGISFKTDSFEGRLKELLEHIHTISVNITVGMPLDDQEQPLPDSVPHVVSYELEADEDLLLRMSRRPDGKLAIDFLQIEHPILKRIIYALLESYTTTDKFGEEEFSDLSEHIDEIVVNMRAPMEQFLPNELIDKIEKPGEQIRLFPVSRGNRKEDIASALRFFLPRTLNDIIRKLDALIKDEINKMQYLGPLRSFPPRHFAFAEHEDLNWYAGGGYAWDVVRRKTDVRDRVNTWLSNKEKLSTPYELSIRNLLTIDDVKTEYEDLSDVFLNEMLGELREGMGWDHQNSIEFIQNVFEKLKISQDNIQNIQELVLIDRRTDTQVSHRDVGIGVSQVLPVLVAAYASKNKIVAIEQPEIHLHPALQAELGDVFIESALGDNKNTFLLESHSEHLILRILRRIRETADNELPDGLTPITPDQVAVLYVQPGKNGAKIIHIPVTEDGEFEKHWPEGFFAERAKELF